jgi:hypothetical protein
MESIGIEFMSGAMLLTTIRVAFLLFVGWIIYRIVRKLLEYDHTGEYKSIKWETIFLGFAIIFGIFFAGATQPKLTIETTPDRELIEYQRNDDEIIIETPPARTEQLDGFTPMNQ